MLIGSSADSVHHDTFLEGLRRRELDLVRKWFPFGTRVLELGGRTGFQAAILTGWGCGVVAIDIDVASEGKPYFEVLKYDGRHIPASDASFDVVYSSHMLYYELGTPDFFSEMRRVLKPGGLAIHIMPTCAWRLATLLAYYPYLAMRIPFHVRRLLLRSLSPLSSGEAPPVPAAAVAVHSEKRWWQWFICSPLDPKSTVWYEFRCWRRANMKRIFAREGFVLTCARPSRLFYTQFALLSTWLPYSIRRSLSFIFGSASAIYITCRSETPNTLVSSQSSHI